MIYVWFCHEMNKENDISERYINRRQRLSLRKYSVGVCSVLLGTALFVAGAPSASAEEVTATPESSTETAATETASSTEEVAETQLLRAQTMKLLQR